jgi:hypothetical protein
MLADATPVSRNFRREIMKPPVLDEIDPSL